MRQVTSSEGEEENKIIIKQHTWHVSCAWNLSTLAFHMNDE